MPAEIFDILTAAFILFGVFFMTVAAVGIVKMPDIYNRMHAQTKGTTLGIAGLLLAGVFAMAPHPDANAVAIITKIFLVVLFIFVANPVAAHVLAKAAHLDNAPLWEGTVDDELKSPPNEPR